ncbi:ubiquinol-cytochrome C chaperone family protein [Thalassospiraceae bacterium LMO-JJ14]|nr:ubiquinol-cytochrome C chaperone family protein [Thalassospiraceae bacterium LMO-JJ14]
MFSLRSLFGTNPDTETARALYAETIVAARRPEFYTAMDVPDTPEGRFEILALMAFLVLRRLKNEADARKISQAFFDVMFDDIDSNLRELGVGDISVGKKVKKLAESFYGRIKAYEEALADDDDARLCQTLARHPYRKTHPAERHIARLAKHVRAEDRHLAEQDVADLLSARIGFAQIAEKPTGGGDT